MSEEARTCSVDGCSRQFRARGMCINHYEQWRMTIPKNREQERIRSRKRRRLGQTIDLSTPEQRERLRRNASEKRKREPKQEQRARHAVLAAIRRDAVERPDSCPLCDATPGRGADGRSLMVAHHEDYSKPLEIEWMCHRCHTDRHFGGLTSEAV